MAVGECLSFGVPRRRIGAGYGQVTGSTGRMCRYVLLSCAAIASWAMLPSAEGRRARDMSTGGNSNALEEFSDGKLLHFGPEISWIPNRMLTPSNTEALLPRFTESIPNVTVSVGKDALLACIVENLRGYKVAWVRVDTQTILSIHHNVITQNPRISLSHNDHRSWYLHIRNAQEADRGWYMCQINTDPMRSRVGYIQVVVPPSIVDKETSSDMVAREGANVTLVCKAQGYPEPYVMWRREDGQDINYNGVNVNVIDGEVITITKVSRLHMGAYLCIASNGVPPSVSKRVLLRVQFPPMLWIPNQLEGAYIGQDVALECHTEAYPTSINYWTTERGDMIISGDKYESVSVENGYKKYMMLKIRNVTHRDFGSYKCMAKNSLGETDGLIKLDEIPAPSTTTTTPAPQPPSLTLSPNDKKKGRSKGRQRHSDTERNEVLNRGRESKDYSSKLSGDPDDMDDNYDSGQPPYLVDLHTASSSSSSAPNASRPFLPLPFLLGAQWAMLTWIVCCALVAGAS
ncbi:lachesin-like isoform X3 [Ischnura elegans]|uniref:lachesin-like isoform X3 n=1 Tax=Ischnura elegans TaxID=197161 RepID=UPI001ED877D7|nr:lachesin-like isoform X3 [Ischnura elegans]